MRHRSTRDVVVDLKKNDRLIEIDAPLSARLEIAEIQRRVYARKGPAILFTNPVNSRFPMVSNLFGSLEQARFVFRHTIERVRRAIELKICHKLGDCPRVFLNSDPQILLTRLTS
jgi:4-hydroxy-3-polyprenylbenzoate decarboxylase